MSTLNSIRCSNCTYYEANSDDSLPCGICRRYPPQYTSYSDGESITSNSFFPEVRQDDWCGEFAYKNKVEVI